MEKKIKFVLSRTIILKYFHRGIWSLCFLGLFLLYPHSFLVKHYISWAVVFFHLSALVLFLFCGRLFYKEYTEENVISIGAILLFVIHLVAYLGLMFGMDLIYGC